VCVQGGASAQAAGGERWNPPPSSLLAPALGTIHAGTIHAGAIHAGAIHAGTIHAGAIHAGTIHAGTIHAGAIHVGRGRRGLEGAWQWT
jgi:hypothetical protein